MTGSDRIDAYLDDLLAALAGRPADVRRVLLEAEAHLYEAVDAGIDAGLDADDAVDAALARFGSARHVARRYRRTDVPTSVVRELVRAFALVAAVGLLAIGASGLVSAGFRAAWGSDFVAGAPAGVTSTVARCADYREYHPEARTCDLAAAAHHADEVVVDRVGAGAVGLVVLAGWWLARRRRPATVAALPPTLVPASAAAAFGLAAAALTVQAIATGGGNGSGQWISASVVSVLVAAAYARQAALTLSA